MNLFAQQEAGERTLVREELALARDIFKNVSEAERKFCVKYCVDFEGKSERSRKQQLCMVPLAG